MYAHEYARMADESDVTGWPTPQRKMDAADGSVGDRHASILLNP